MKYEEAVGELASNAERGALSLIDDFNWFHRDVANAMESVSFRRDWPHLQLTDDMKEMLDEPR